MGIFPTWNPTKFDDSERVSKYQCGKYVGACLIDSRFRVDAITRWATNFSETGAQTIMVNNFEFHGQEHESMEPSMNGNLHSEAFEIQRLQELVKRSESIVAIATKSADSICDYYCQRLFSMTEKEQAEFIDSISCYTDEHDLVWNGVRKRYNDHLAAQAC